MEKLSGTPSPLTSMRGGRPAQFRGHAAPLGQIQRLCHGLDEAMFFANATSMTLEALRLGSKWAFRAKEPLQLALAA